MDSALLLHSCMHSMSSKYSLDGAGVRGFSGTQHRARYLRGGMLISTKYQCLGFCIIYITALCRMFDAMKVSPFFQIVNLHAEAFFCLKQCIFCIDMRRILGENGL